MIFRNDINLEKCYIFKKNVPVCNGQHFVERPNVTPFCHRHFPVRRFSEPRSNLSSAPACKQQQRPSVNYFSFHDVMTTHLVTARQHARHEFHRSRHTRAFTLSFTKTDRDDYSTIVIYLITCSFLKRYGHFDFPDSS